MRYRFVVFEPSSICIVLLYIHKYKLGSFDKDRAPIKTAKYYNPCSSEKEKRLLHLGNPKYLPALRVSGSSHRVQDCGLSASGVRWRAQL